MNRGCQAKIEKRRDGECAIAISTAAQQGGAPNMCSKVVKRGVRTFTPHYRYVSRSAYFAKFTDNFRQILYSFVDVKGFQFRFHIIERVLLIEHGHCLVDDGGRSCGRILNHRRELSLVDRARSVSLNAKGSSVLNKAVSLFLSSVHGLCESAEPGGLPLAFPCQGSDRESECDHFPRALRPSVLSFACDTAPDRGLRSVRAPLRSGGAATQQIQKSPADARPGRPRAHRRAP